MRKHNGWRLAANLLVGLFVGIASFCAFLYRWTFATWANLQLDELVYELTASLEGTSPEIIRGGVMFVLLPTFGMIILYAVLSRMISVKKPQWHYGFLCACLIAGITVSGLMIRKAAERLELGAHILGSQTESTFIEDHYISANDVQMTFPEKKRNLIYIYLESMETTWMDKASGGQFETNLIPELTHLAMENEDFSGNDDIVNGAYALNGTTWTMGAMFAHTTGLPLKISIEGSSMNTQETFFSDIVSLGDILEQEGYNQALLIGSDANFGGRKLYFTEHGGFRILDYAYAIENKQIPSDHFVWWGYEDFRLFEHAKQELLSMAAQDEPFNLTMLTVDTHMDEGYVCEYCTDIHGERYSNVYSCSSRQVDEFIKWIQQQEFYENTTVVVVGDHPTMSPVYDDRINKEDRKVYTAFINSVVEYKNDEKRVYSTYDFFPTALAAMGVIIEGDRLGLGTNLYSDMPTLIEQYGIDRINGETRKKSSFMERMGRIKKNLIKDAILDISAGRNETEIRVKVLDIVGVEESIKSVEVEIWNDHGKAKIVPMEFMKDGSYEVYIDISEYERSYGNLNIWITDENDNRYIVKKIEGNLRLSGSRTVETYLERLRNLDNCAIMIAVLDDAAYSLSEDAQESLRALGLKTEWKDMFRHSYCAIVTPDDVFEKYAQTPVEHRGKLVDGTQYSLLSTAYRNDIAGINIKIDGEEYAQELRGMSFAVYDLELKKVVSTANFDTCLNAPSAKIGVNKTSFNKIQVELKDVQMYNPAKEVYVRYWNGYEPEKIYKQDITDGDVEGVYSQIIRIPLLMSRNGYMVAYAVDTMGRTFRLAETEF